MGKTVKARKATFTSVSGKNGRQFTPVNRHAKAFATVLGLSTLEAKHLKAIKKAGFKTYEYVDGALKAIAL